MSLLTIAKAVAKDAGLAVPTTVVGSSDRSMVELLDFANAAGEELARRVDWGQLTASTTLTGDGTDKQFALPAGFSRIVQGIGVINSGGAFVRSLARAEWGSLTMAQGVPRYFLLQDNDIRLFPYLAAAATAMLYYQSGFWCSNGTAAWASDDDTSLIDENLFRMALVVRWRRQKGMEYADQEAEYEAALADYARFNDRARL